MRAAVTPWWERMGTRRRVDDVLTAIAAYGLRDSSPGASSPLDTETWIELTELVARQRLTGLLIRAIREGRLPATAEQTAQAARLQLMSCRRVLGLEHAMLKTVRLFEEAGIDSRILKGAALSHGVYQAPELRVYVDIDILVPSDCFDAAVDLLRGQGYDRVRPEPRRGFVSRFGKSAELVHPDRISVDLHRSLAPGVWAVLIDPDRLFETGTTITLGDRQVVGLGSAERFVHACLHATVGNLSLRLMPLRDVVETLLHPGLDLDRALRLAEEWEALSVVAAAVKLAWDVLDPARVPALAGWSATFTPGDTERRRLALGEAGERADLAESLAMLRAIPGPSGKASYLASLAFPSASYLEEKGQTPLGRLVKGARRLTGGNGN